LRDRLLQAVQGKKSEEILDVWEAQLREAAEIVRYEEAIPTAAGILAEEQARRFREESATPPPAPGHGHGH
jgi:hypothetical protein